MVKNDELDEKHTPSFWTTFSLIRLIISSADSVINRVFFIKKPVVEGCI
jgi:hypothetical protein